MRLPAALLASLACACASIRVGTDYDVEADFTTFETYGWVESDPGEHSDELTARRVRAAVDDVLASSGFRAVDSEPDFRVAFQFVRRDRVRITDHGSVHAYHAFGAWGVRDIDVYEYQEGTLILDVVDAATDRLVWRGTARQVVDDDRTPEERTARVRAAVEALLERFPPQR